MADGRVDSARAAGRLQGRGQAPHPRRHGAARRSDRQRDLAPCCSARSRAPRCCRCSAWRSRRRSIAAASASSKASRRSARALPPPKAGRCRSRPSTPVATHISPALAPLMAEADAYAEPARMFVRAGIERLADYQDIAYARDYLDRLKPIAEIDRAARRRLGTAARRDRARAGARHGLRGHRPRRRAEDPPEPLRARARRGAGRRRADRRDRRVPASARAGDRRHAAGRASAAGCLDTGWARRFVERFTKAAGW